STESSESGGLHSQARSNAGESRMKTFRNWYGLDSTGKPNGPLKAGIVVHICDAGGTQISEETTRQWEA
ncbi:hypothetical protein, partial [Victivallis vadensis]|uniref:hypothetical protein n=1 Tax=Victivallis vadensis TaxID=172901 RepID=UPI003CFD7A6C